MAAYCARFYVEQRKVEDKYPRPDLASRVAFTRQLAKLAHRTESMLADLTPPAGMAAAYAEFVANAHEVSEARTAMADSVASTGEAGIAGEVFDEAMAARWPLATELHAPGCDGQLPPDQEAAVVAALKKFETTTDSTSACRDLATPGYLLTRWPDNPDPLAGCIAMRDSERRSADGPARAARDIQVQTVTGSDGVAATVHYTGGCRCTNGAVARFHLVDHSWLVSEVSH